MKAREMRKLTQKRIKREGFWYRMEHTISMRRVMRKIKKRAKDGKFNHDCTLEGYTAVEVSRIKDELIENGFKVSEERMIRTNIYNSDDVTIYPYLEIDWS